MSTKGQLVLLLLVIASSLTQAAKATADFESPPEECYTHDLAIETTDGVKIRGTLYRGDNRRVLIYCHRLLGDKDGHEVGRLKTAFLDRYDLIVYDSRGHKLSFGRSTCGGEEILDLHAVLSFCKHRGYEKIAVLGAGMGGAIGARTARIFRNIDVLVVVSPSSFSPRVAPFLVRVISDKTFDTLFGRIPLRVITDTRLGSRYTAGFPGDDSLSTTSVPTLVLQAERDPLVNLEQLQTILGPLQAYGTFLTVSGRKHAEDLLTDSTLQLIKDFLRETLGPEDAPSGHTGLFVDGKRDSMKQSALPSPSLVGDSPLPRALIIQELQDRLGAATIGAPYHDMDHRGIAQQVEEILHFHGYTRASVSPVGGTNGATTRISCPRINSVEVTGNRWLGEAHLRRVHHLGNDYFNAYELDGAIRRLSSEMGVKSTNYSVAEGPDGDLDIHIVVREHRTLGLVLSSKFTDIDDFFGLGVKWQEFNPDAFQYEGAVMLGVSDQDWLHTHRWSKNLLRRQLQLQLDFFDVIRSRDDLAYVFTRQEARELGGEVACRYKVTSNLALRFSIFDKEYAAPRVTDDLPVTKGVARGLTTKLSFAGSLPIQAEPRFRWEHTSFYQKAGLGDEGDFDFETYQFNMSTLYHLTGHHDMRATYHGGWVSLGAPPQEQLSLGGMTTLPGYPDDSYVNSRMTMASAAVRFSAASVFDETSIWSPVRLILSIHSGTVWGQMETFGVDELRSDIGLEFDYEETVRLGVAWPFGNQYDESGRFYIGWGPHVF